MLAIGLSHRVNLAWGATILLLVAGAAFAAAQGARLWIAGVLVLTTLLIAPFRASFYRHARLLAGPLEASTALYLLSLVVCLLALAGFRQHVRALPNNAWWSVVLSPDLPNSLRLSVALTVALALVAIWRLVRPGRVTWHPWNDEARLRLARFGPLPPTGADGVVWGEARAGRHRLPPLRARAAGPGRPGRRRGGPGVRDLAPARPGAGGGTGPGHLARRAGAAEGLWRYRADRVAAGGGRPAVARGGGRKRPTAERYLVCVAERDLSTLLPLLPGLALAEAAE